MKSMTLQMSSSAVPQRSFSFTKAAMGSRLFLLIVSRSSWQRSSALLPSSSKAAEMLARACLQAISEDSTPQKTAQRDVTVAAL